MFPGRQVLNPDTAGLLLLGTPVTRLDALIPQTLVLDVGWPLVYAGCLAYAITQARLRRPPSALRPPPSYPNSPKRATPNPKP